MWASENMVLQFSTFPLFVSILSAFTCYQVAPGMIRSSLLGTQTKPLWPESRAPRWGWERGGRTRMPFRSTFAPCCPSSDAHLSWPPLTDPLFFFFWTPRVDVLISWCSSQGPCRPPAGARTWQKQEVHARLHAPSPKTVLLFLVISSCSTVSVTYLSVACGSWMFSPS